MVHSDLSINIGTGHHFLSVALTDPVQRFSGYHVKEPGLRIHRRGRSLGDRDNLCDQFPRNRLILISADTSSFCDQLIEIIRFHFTVLI